MSMSVIKAITLCGERYGFNVSEAMEMCKRSDGKRSVVVSKVVSKVVVLKEMFALPYNGELNDSLCLGISRNSGVYSQCHKKRETDKSYCSTCSKEASNNSHGLPNYGNIADRQLAYLNKEEFKDPSGKSPILYSKLMKKLKLSEEQVRRECEKMGVTLDPINLEEKTMKKSGRPKQIKAEKPEKEIKAKGRPKKSKKVLELAGEEEDLFASLVMSSLANSSKEIVTKEIVTKEIVTNEIVSNVSVSVSEIVAKVVEEIVVEEKVVEEIVCVDETKAKVVEEIVVEEAKEKITKTKKSSSANEEKALAKLKEKEEKEEKALEKLKEKLSEAKEKEEKALEKLKEKEVKEEKLKIKGMNILMLKLEKEKQKEELIEKKAALALEKVKAKDLLKESKEKKTKVSKKVSVTSVENLVETAVETLEEEDHVKKIMFEGKKYLKSTDTGVIYNMDQDEIGKWNEVKQRIDFNDEEESEDEYDEDN
jgi:hypothetical protein